MGSTLKAEAICLEIYPSDLPAAIPASLDGLARDSPHMEQAYTIKLPASALAARAWCSSLHLMSPLSRKMACIALCLIQGR